MRESSSFRKEKLDEIPKEYNEFMNKFPNGVVLIGFGVTWVPDIDVVARLVKAI